MEKMFFDRPTQVMFSDKESKYCGIAYKDEIICACCGGIFSTDEVQDIQVLKWVDFSSEIGDWE